MSLVDIFNKLPEQEKIEAARQYQELLKEQNRILAANKPLDTQAIIDVDFEVIE